jgi:methanogenic corrinoid protein MtbC1
MSVHGLPEDGVSRHSESGSWQRNDSRSDPAIIDDCAIPTSVSVPHFQRLVRAVEGEIVPRLLLARRAPVPVAVPANAAEIEPREADELARLLLRHEVDVPFAYAESIRYRGASTRDIYIKLLAPAARCLGEMWDQDECDFMQVTLGLGRLHQLMQRIGQMTPGPESLDSRGHGRRVLLATAPGEKHSFGVVMVSHFFRQNGWDVFNEFPGSTEALAECVRTRSFALVGLSANSDAQLDALIAAVRAVRRNSLNAAVGIMVGGVIFQQHPDWVARVGADATAEDGEQAALLAESVSALLAGEK